MPFTFMYGMTFLVISVCTEKEKKLIEAMKMMGLKVNLSLCLSLFDASEKKKKRRSKQSIKLTMKTQLNVGNSLGSIG